MRRSLRSVKSAKRQRRRQERLKTLRRARPRFKVPHVPRLDDSVDRITFYVSSLTPLVSYCTVQLERLKVPGLFACPGSELNFRSPSLQPLSPLALSYSNLTSSVSTPSRPPSTSTPPSPLSLSCSVPLSALRQPTDNGGECLERSNAQPTSSELQPHLGHHARCSFRFILPVSPARNAGRGIDCLERRQSVSRARRIPLAAL